jgi:predicted nucleotide-binding protein
MPGRNDFQQIPLWTNIPSLPRSGSGAAVVDISEPSDVRSALERTARFLIRHGRMPARRAAEAAYALIVHGSDWPNRELLKHILREWHVRFRVLQEQPAGPVHLSNRVQQAIREAAFVIVLYTSDDRVRTRDKKSYKQPRANVYFELGRVMEAKGADRICILRQSDAHIPSDLEGCVRLDFTDSVKDQESNLKELLTRAGLC